MEAHKKIGTEKYSTIAFRDLIILAAMIIVLLVLSYFFNIFIFLVELFQKYPKTITYIDEIFTLFIVLSTGLAVFSWRRWRELKKETARRIELQEELLLNANTKAETERIINKQLHCEIQMHRLGEKNKSAVNPDFKK
jgi:membrane protein implicated in regulation of membrane protease activity